MATKKRTSTAQAAAPGRQPSRAVSPGIQRVVDGNGDVSYKAQIRRRGYPSEARRFALLDDAQRWKRAREAELDRGVVIDRREAEKHTVGDLLRRYAAEVSPGKRGADVELVRLNAMQRDPLARINAGAVNGQHVAGWIARRAVSPSTVNRELNLLHHVFEKARRAWGMHIANPVALVERPPSARPRERRMSASEVDAICAATGSEHLATIVRLAAATAMRRGEIVGLAWADIDIANRIVTLERTKNGDRRRVPLSAAAVAVLAALPRPIDGGPLFKLDPHSVSTAFRRALGRARAEYEATCAAERVKPDPEYLVGLRLHDGRHEAISALVEAGVDQLTTARIAGHKSLAMTQRYYNPSDEHLVAAVDRVAVKAR